MSRHLTITIPEPCTVPWNSMSRVDEYRSHCASCATVVIDFSEMTEAEIVSYMQERAGQKSCGRFRQSQLNRPMPLIPQKKQKAVWWKAAVMLPLSFFFHSLKGQQINVDSAQTLTTAEKDSVQLASMSSLHESEETTIFPDTSQPAATIDSANTNNADIVLNVEKEDGDLMAKQKNTLYTLEFTMGDISIMQENPVECNPQIFGNIAVTPEDYWYYSFLDKLKQIAYSFVTPARPKTDTVAQHHPYATHIPALHAQEPRITLPESRKRNKNNHLT
ncbi:MAG: hypothetical protein MUC87_09515 [Bacteroidia bacterium]|jgi:hypothetical protein|nr:hypothetical protein [Bacteroidia bacterium]